jgi:hypothetical protein
VGDQVTAAPVPDIDGIPGFRVAGAVMGQARMLAARMNARGGRRTIRIDAPGTMSAIRRQLAEGVHPADVVYRIEMGFYAVAHAKTVASSLAWAQLYVPHEVDGRLRADSRESWRRWWREYVADRRDPSRWKRRHSEEPAEYKPDCCYKCGAVPLVRNDRIRDYNNDLCQSHFAQAYGRA